VSNLPAVEIDGLVKRYRSVTAVAGLSLRAERAQVTAILGPNGAGKTTTIEICEGYRKADGGTVRVLGLDPVTDARELRSKVGVMLQTGGVPTSARAAEYLRVMAGFYANPLDPAALLTAVGLTGSARTPYKQLSGGQQQRLALAAAVIGRPELVFLEEAERLADQVVIVDHGQVVASGGCAELTGSDGQLRFRAEPGLDLAGLLAALPAGAIAKESPSGHYLVEVAERVDPQLIASVTAWCAEHGVLARDLQIESRTLEDLFLELTGRGLRS